jgi:deoxyribodipyrimidine photo-lyase
MAELLKDAEAFLPVYVVDPRMFVSHKELGFSRTGPLRARFLRESLDSLKKELRRLGSDLQILCGYPEIEIPRLSELWDPDIIGFEKGVAPEEIQIELDLFDQVKSRWFLKSQYSKSLLHPLELPFGLDELPKVFTSFRKKVEKSLYVRAIVPAPVSLPEWPSDIQSTEIPSEHDFGDSDIVADSRGVWDFKGGEAAAMQRLQHYFWESKAVAAYKQRRNGLIGESYSSKFSPWLAVGCLSPRRIYHELCAFEASFGATEDTYWLKFELLWRDFFRWTMYSSGAKLFQMKGFLQESPDVKIDEKLFRKWVEGRTQDEFVNANMNELRLTGFMSNRGRQNVASFFCHALKLPWIWGAAYFEHALLDYDVCSNWGNWAYLAGVGNDPREGRIFNTVKQAAFYDPEGAYVNLWR